MSLIPSEAWVPVVPGVKSLTAKPTRAQLMAQERVTQIIQQRFERWMLYRYQRTFGHIRNEVLALEEIPDPLTIQGIVMNSVAEQEETLRRLYLQVYPMGASMVLSDDTLKSMRMGYESKELTESWDPVILQWIAEILGVTVNEINSTTARGLEEIRNQVLIRDGTVEEFRDVIMGSNVLGPARARTIAVTETNAAVNSSLNSASHEAADGRPMVKRWRTSHRINVRETHRVMEGVEIPFEDLYSVPSSTGGYDLMAYPGDRTYNPSPGNTINCHCKSFPRLAN